VPAVADLEPFRAAGFYDPAAPDADDKAAMIELLLSFGLGADDVLEAFRGDYVHSAGIVPLLRRGDVSVRTAASRLSITVDDVLETYRLLGIRFDDVDEPVLLIDEVDVIGLLRGSEEAFEQAEIDEINRTTSAALTALTESVVAVFVAGAEARLQGAEHIGWAARAQATQSAGELGLRFGHAIGLFFRHHLRQAVERQRSTMVAATSRVLRTMTVGFVDLVGYTSLSAAMDSAELVEFIRDFEARSYDVASRGGGRVVKIIGDEVMVAALSVEAGCEIVLDLIDAFRTGDTAPRGGMASGQVISRLGDYFGPVVNLASRLADLAVPGEVLADAGKAGSLGTSFACDPAGRRLLKGFTEPVEVVWVRRQAGAGQG
jgi:adenylate cyclase